jgi:hypothetical protein
LSSLISSRVLNALGGQNLGQQAATYLGWRILRIDEDRCPGDLLSTPAGAPTGKRLTLLVHHQPQEFSIIVLMVQLSSGLGSSGFAPQAQ